MQLKCENCGSTNIEVLDIYDRDVYVNRHGIIESILDMSIPISFKASEYDVDKLTKYQSIVFKRLVK